MTIIDHHETLNLCAEQLAEAYEASDEFTTDAIEEVAVAGDLPADLVGRIEEWYRTTKAFDVKIEDALNGEVAW